MRAHRNIAAALALLAAVGCVQPYKVEVQQGNVVTQEMVALLKPGMTKSQVRFVLGTPLVTDPFHANRWDYVYVYKKHARAPAETRHLTVIFDGDTVVRLEGDLAAAADAFGEGQSEAAENRQPPPARSSSTSARGL